MKRIIKNNIVISVPESELDYYRAQGYKVVGEKETVGETVSRADYEKLETELEEKNAEIAELKESNSKLETELEEKNAEIAELKDKVLTSEESEKKKGAK